MRKKPYLITFQSIGDDSIGFVSVAQNHKDIPFDIKRAFWTYSTPIDVIRGHHAHKKQEQVLISVGGKIIVHTEAVGEEKQSFFLDKPNMGLFIPSHCWRTIEFLENAALFVLASTEYDANEYIRDYEIFKSNNF